MSEEEEIARKTIPSPQNGSDLAYTWAETKQIMEAHTNQVLHDLSDDIDRNVGSWDSDCRFNECKQQVLKLVESYYNK